MIHLKIKQKVLLLFIVISLGPLGFVSYLLVNTAQRQLKTTASVQQDLVAKQNAERVDSFLGAKVNNLIFQSQTSSVRQFNIADAELNLAAATKQDRDIRQIALVDKSGNEKVVLNKDGLVTKHINVADSDAFKAATFLAGKEYIGPVNYDDQHEPFVVIAVPLIRFTAQQDLTRLSTAEFGKYRSPDDIVGVLIAEYSLSDLWQSVLSTKIGVAGYAYVVDDKGNLIAHPDSDFLKRHQNIANVHQVDDFLHNRHDNHESESETGVKVLSTFQSISRSNWGVIVEEPLRDVFANISAFYKVSFITFLAVAAIALILSLVFRSQLLTPIRNMVTGTKRIGAGDLAYKLNDKTHDELGELAHNFNIMAGSLQQLIGNLKTQNIALASDERKLSNIIQSVGDGIIAINHNYEIVSVNPPATRLSATQYEQLIGKKLGDNFIWKKDEKPFEVEIGEPGIFQQKDLLMNHGDQWAYVDLTVAIISTETPNDVAAIITVHDNTQARELEVMKLDFVSIAAHELRTPLTSLQGYLSLIESDATPQLSATNSTYLQRAIVSAGQLGNLINSLLNVTQIEQGVMRFTMSKLDIADLINKIVERHKQSADFGHQNLVYEGQASHVFVPADSDAISEVLESLLSNAYKYTPEGGQITVRLRTNDKQVRVEVADNGEAIPESAIPHLFTKFYRVEHDLISGKRGTGLGLYMSKAIITLHYGKIGVQSSPGQGTTFFFTLPVFQD